LKHEQKEKEQHAREELFNLVSKVSEEEVNEDTMNETLKMIESNVQIEENLVRLKHILKDGKFLAKAVEKLDEKIIKILLN